MFKSVNQFFAFFIVLLNISSAMASVSSRYLLLLSVAQEPAGVAREEHFFLELSLLLETTQVKKIVLDNREFVHSSPGEQIGIVGPLIAAHGAVAAVWLESVSSQVLVLHIVAVNHGRAIYRMVETAQVDGCEAELAITARELLDTAFPLQENGPGTTAVAPDEQNDAAVGDTKGKPRFTPQTNWYLTPWAQVEGGIAKYRGPSLQIGSAVALDRRLVSRLFGRIALGVKGGYPDNGEKYGISTFGMEAGGGLLYLWSFQHVSLASIGEVHFVWSTLSATRVGADVQMFSTMGYRVGALVQTVFHLPAFVDLMLACGATLFPYRDTFVRASTDQTVITTPLLGWALRIGVLFQL